MDPKRNFDLTPQKSAQAPKKPRVDPSDGQVSDGIPAPSAGLSSAQFNKPPPYALPHLRSASRRQGKPTPPMKPDNLKTAASNPNSRPIGNRPDPLKDTKPNPTVTSVPQGSAVSQFNKPPAFKIPYLPSASGRQGQQRASSRSVSWPQGQGRQPSRPNSGQHSPRTASPAPTLQMVPSVLPLHQSIATPPSALTRVVQNQQLQPAHPVSVMQTAPSLLVNQQMAPPPIPSRQKMPPPFPAQGQQNQRIAPPPLSKPLNLKSAALTTVSNNGNNPDPMNGSNSAHLYPIFNQSSSRPRASASKTAVNNPNPSSDSASNQVDSILKDPLVGDTSHDSANLVPQVSVHQVLPARLRATVERPNVKDFAQEPPTRPRSTVDRPTVDDFDATREVRPLILVSDNPDHSDDDEEFAEELMSEDQVRKLRERFVAQSSQIQNIVDDLLREESQGLNDMLLETLDNRAELLQPVMISVPVKGEDHLDTNEKLLLEARSRSLRDIVWTALDFTGMPCDPWVAHRKRSVKTRFSVLEQELVTMLASMDDQVLEHLIKGDIAKAAHLDPNFNDKLEAFKIRGPDVIMPFIYIQTLVNGRGESPSANGLLYIIGEIELYMRGWQNPDDKESEERARRIDNSSRTDYRNGFRKYIESQTHYNNLKAWVTILKARCRNVPADKMHEPLARPLSEIGWAKDLTKRLAQHRKHSSSNYLMNLTEAVCRNSFADYSIHQYGIFRVFEECHAMLGEIIFSRIGQVYITYGGGFSHCAAGISHQGAYQLLETDYRLLKLAVSRNPDFTIRMREETRKTRELATDLRESFKAVKTDRERVQYLAKKIPELRQNITETEALIQRQREEYIQKATPFATMLNIMRRRKEAKNNTEQSRTDGEAS